MKTYLSYLTLMTMTSLVACGGGSSNDDDPSTRNNAATQYEETEDSSVASPKSISQFSQIKGQFTVDELDEELELLDGFPVLADAYQFTVENEGVLKVDLSSEDENLDLDLYVYLDGAFIGESTNDFAEESFDEDFLVSEGSEVVIYVDFFDGNVDITSEYLLNVNVSGTASEAGPAPAPGGQSYSVFLAVGSTCQQIESTSRETIDGILNVEDDFGFSFSEGQCDASAYDGSCDIGSNDEVTQTLFYTTGNSGVCSL